MIINFLRSKLIGEKGLEIAGPSSNFSDTGVFPIYPLLSELHDISFPRPLDWGGRPLDILAQFDGPRLLAHQFVGDAELDKVLPNQRYRCILSSHVIEHLINPLRTLRMWAHLLDDQGLMIHILPHKENTFDARRPVTELEHLIADDAANVDYTDISHYDEVRRLSLERHSEQWFADVPRHRGMHQHVFDTKLCIEMFAYVGMHILFCIPILPYHIVVVAQRHAGTEPEQKWEDFRSVMLASPFMLDRVTARTPHTAELS